jgi:spermidine/putrescine transport system substrate-binding protein
MPDRNSIWERTYDRKGFVAISALAALTTACGSDDDEGGSAAGDTTATETTQQLGGTLHYYNWADYVNPKTYPAFTKATGVKIKKSFFVSNEDLQAKLQAGARGYDLAAPTGYMVKILAEAGLLEKIDWSQLPNAEANIEPKFRGLPFDPNDEWSVAKDWGTTGFVYRTDLVKEKPATWRDFYDLATGPYSKKVTVLDGAPEVIGSTLVMLGHSYNSEDEAELEQAKQEMLKLEPGRGARLDQLRLRARPQRARDGVHLLRLAAQAAAAEAGHRPRGVQERRRVPGRGDAREARGEQHLAGGDKAP